MCHLGQDCLIDSIFPCTSLPTLPLTAFLFLFRLRTTKKVNPLFPKMRTTLASATGLLFAVVTVNADVYMHNPRGSNNRLNERSANRNNGNRMFDSQVRHHSRFHLFLSSFGLGFEGVHSPMYAHVCFLNVDAAPEFVACKQPRGLFLAFRLDAKYERGLKKSRKTARDSVQLTRQSGTCVCGALWFNGQQFRLH